MKKYKKYKSLIAIAVIGLFAFSCLNDTGNDFSAVAPTAEMLGVQAGKSIAYSLSGDPVDSILVTVNVTGANSPSTDVTLSLGTSQAYIDLYNKDTTHVAGTLLAESTNAYKYPSTVTIKAGKDELGNSNRSGQFWLVLTGANIPSTPGVNYVIAIAITAAPSGYVISSNQGGIMYNFYHNPYDGNYTSNGTRYNFNVATDYAGWDAVNNKPLAGSAIASTAPWSFTTGVQTVNAANSWAHIGQGADLSFLGAQNLKVNGDDLGGGVHSVTISSTCAANDATCGGITTAVPNFFPLAGGPKSTYDPATKKFNLYYQWTNANGTFRVCHDVMVHQ